MKNRKKTILALAIVLLFGLAFISCPNSDISVSKTRIAIPALTQTSFVHTGSPISVSLNTANEAYSLSGNTETEIGSYFAIVTLNDTDNYEWAGGSTAPLELPWSIISRMDSSKLFVQSVRNDMGTIFNAAMNHVPVPHELDSWWGLASMLDVLLLYEELEEDKHCFGSTTIAEFGIALTFDIISKLYENRVDLFSEITISIGEQVQDTNMFLVSIHQGQGDEKWTVHLRNPSRTRNGFTLLGPYHGTFFDEQKITYYNNGNVTMLNLGMATDISIDTPLDVFNVFYENLNFAANTTITAAPPLTEFTQEYLATYPAFDGHPVDRLFTEQERQDLFDHLIGVFQADATAGILDIFDGTPVGTIPNYVIQAILSAFLP